MSEFAPICISFLISLLVSWVLLGLIFASNSSTHALFRKRGIPFLFVATLVLFCYLVVLLVGFDFHLLFSKMESLILRKGLSFFLQRVGWEVGLFLAIILALFDVESPAISNMMTPSGASGASSSGNWRQYLNFSSGNEGDSAPEQSTSSTWSGSWIGRWFNQEVAPNEGGHEATSQPTGTGVMEQEQAGPSHQALFVIPNSSLEASMRNRVLALENENTPFLLDKERGQYWNEIKAALDQAPSQAEYNRLVAFENRDLQIRELRHRCAGLIQGFLSESHPQIMREQPDRLLNFFDYNRQTLEDEFPIDVNVVDFRGVSSYRTPNTAAVDQAEIQSLQKMFSDLERSGSTSYSFSRFRKYEE